MRDIQIMEGLHNVPYQYLFSERPRSDCEIRIGIYILIDLCVIEAHNC